MGLSEKKKHKPRESFITYASKPRNFVTFPRYLRQPTVVLSSLKHYLLRGWLRIEELNIVWFNLVSKDMKMTRKIAKKYYPYRWLRNTTHIVFLCWFFHAGVKHIAGNMFEGISNIGDAIFLKVWWTTYNSSFSMNSISILKTKIAWWS